MRCARLDDADLDNVAMWGKRRITLRGMMRAVSPRRIGARGADSCLHRGASSMTSAYAFDGASFRPLDWQPQRTLRWAAWRPGGATCCSRSAMAVRRCSLMGRRSKRWIPARSRTSAAPPGRPTARPRCSWAIAAPSFACAAKRSMSWSSASPAENLRRVAWHPTRCLRAGRRQRRRRPALRRRFRDALAPLPGDRAHTLRSVAFRPDGAYALVGAYASRHAGYPTSPAPLPLRRPLPPGLARQRRRGRLRLDRLVGGLRRAGLRLCLAPDGSLVNKALLFDGSSWQTLVWESKGVVLGGAWRPATTMRCWSANQGWRCVCH